MEFNSVQHSGVFGQQDGETMFTLLTWDMKFRPLDPFSKVFDPFRSVLHREDEGTNEKWSNLPRPSGFGRFHLVARRDVLARAALVEAPMSDWLVQRVRRAGFDFCGPRTAVKPKRQDSKPKEGVDDLGRNPRVG